MRERPSSSYATPSRTPPDSGDPRVTWRASDVLAQRTGICYAKAHALAALLRAEDIPPRSATSGSPTTTGRTRCPRPGRRAAPRQTAGPREDPRGNKPGVDAQFSLDGERLAWAVREELGEVDYLGRSTPHRPPRSSTPCGAPATGRTLWRNLPTQL